MSLRDIRGRRCLAGVLALAVLALAQQAQAADAAAGRTKAGATCKTCHGVDGIGRMPNVPHIAGESDIYLITQLKAFREGMRTHEIMSIIAKDLSDADIENLAAWYSGIEISVTVPE